MAFLLKAGKSLREKIIFRNKHKGMRYSISLLFLLIGSMAVSQNDTITLTNKDVLVGKIVKLEKSVLTFSTDYSDSDFKIDWRKVMEIKSHRTFIIANSNGQRVTGRLNSVEEKEKVIQLEYDAKSSESNLMDIVFLKPIGQRVLSNLSIDVDLGITFTKANNLKQFNSFIGGTYLARKWNADVYFKNVLSQQANADNISRMDAAVGGEFYLPKDWFVALRAKYLANDGQLLNLRSTYQGGLGYYFINSNTMQFALLGGMAYTGEVFSNDTPNRYSTEGLIGLGLQKFSIGDLTFSSTAAYYPSFSQSGRYRIDFNGHMKYNLPLNFYIKLSASYNFDSDPIEGAADSDYVFTTSFGWEFN